VGIVFGIQWYSSAEKASYLLLLLKKRAANKGSSTMAVNGEHGRKELKKIRVTP
jgi:hypothetical protein